MAPATNAKTAAEPPAAAKTRIQNRFSQGHVRRAPDSLGLRLPAEIIGNLSALSGALATRLNRLPRTQVCCLQKSCHFAVPEANFMGAIARLDVNALFHTDGSQDNDRLSRASRSFAASRSRPPFCFF